MSTEKMICPKCGSQNVASVSGIDREDIESIAGCGDCGYQEDAYEFHEAWADKKGLEQ